MPNTTTNTTQQAPTCKDCIYNNCSRYRRCDDCPVSDYGTTGCYCVTVNYQAVLCKYFKSKEINKQ